MAYGALLQIGLYPHVLMGDPDQWPPWTSASYEDALAEIKRRFALESPSDHDAFLLDLLKSRLTVRDEKYVWPQEVRSALVYWKGSAYERAAFCSSSIRFEEPREGKVC